jgi:hypothetical protein
VRMIELGQGVWSRFRSKVGWLTMFMNVAIIGN